MAAAAAATLVPPQRKGRALGMVLGGMSAGTVVGVPLGLLISAQFGWQVTLWLVTLVGIIGLIGVWARFPDIAVTPPPSFKARLAMLTEGRVAATVGITFLAAIASLGLYTYVSPVLQGTAKITEITPYLWSWGVGGVAGSFSIGWLIDKTGKPGWLLAGILLILSMALIGLPAGLHAGAPLAWLPFLFWGAAGWASLAPQQHALLALQPAHGAAAVALNSSCNYLGSAVGTLLGAVLITAGHPPSQLPYWAAAVGLAALLGQLGILATSQSAR